LVISGDDLHQETDTTSSSARASKKASKSLIYWSAWEDRALAKAVNLYRPFLAKRKDIGHHWEDVRRDLSGVNITRTAASCKTRFGRLMDAHRAESLRSLQKTGTDEEVTEFMELMESLVSLHDQIASDQVVRRATKRKHEEENERGKVLRNIMMEGQSNRQSVIARGEATATEASSSQTPATASPDVPSRSLITKPPNRRRVLAERVENMVAKLANAQEEDEERMKQLQVEYQEEVERGERITNSLTNLTQVLADDIKRRDKDHEEQQERMRVDHEEQQERMRAIESQQATTATILADIVGVLKSLKG